jgi:hypothetical protein
MEADIRHLSLQLVRTVLYKSNCVLQNFSGDKTNCSLKNIRHLCEIEWLEYV